MDKARVVTGKQGPCPIEPFNVGTSPSNIALDLLVQLEASRWPELAAGANLNLSRTLSALVQLEIHPEYQLFFNRYRAGDGKPLDFYISSIDNFHLALALYTVAHDRPNADEGKAAARLLSRMRFEPLLDWPNGLIFGGLRRPTANAPWKAESWTYRYFGSEARSIYAAGEAIGLFMADSEWRARSVPALDREVFKIKVAEQEYSLLGLWDGGAFQLYLPDLLLDEVAYSAELGKLLPEFARYMVAEGQARSLGVPAAHSACEFPKGYRGKAGVRAAVSSQNADLRDPQFGADWDRVFTPHAAFLAAPYATGLYLPALERAGLYHDSKTALYQAGIGWMDGFVVGGQDQGSVVPVILSFDQGMIALSVARMLSADGRTTSARTLARDPVASARLRSFYSLAKLAPFSGPRKSSAEK